MIIPKQYIFMCRAAPELREHEPEEGDLYALPNGVVFVIASYCFRVDDARHRVYLAIPPKMRPSEILGKPDFKSPVFEKREYELYPMKYWTWLPSVEQLQEMLFGFTGGYFSSTPMGSGHSWMTWDKEKPKLLLKVVSNFVGHEEVREYFKSFTSIRELWLAFIRKEKYNQVWNPKSNQWIEADSLQFSPP